MTIRKPEPATLIDTLSAGYTAINRRPWLILVPILLNIYLWYGAQVSFSPLIDDVRGFMERVQSASVQSGEFQDQGGAVLQDLGSIDMRRQLALFNYIPVLTLNAVAPLASDGSATSLPFIRSLPLTINPQRTDTIVVNSVGGAVLSFIVINALALPLSAIFLTLVAAAVRGDTAAPTDILRRSIRAGLSFAGYVLVVGGVLLALGLPFIFLTTLLITLNTTIGALALSLMFIVWFWIQIYIGFTREAIVMSGLGPLQAIRASFNVVRRNFWATLGFLILWYVISMGCGVIWQMLSGSVIGLIFAVVGSAYVGSGLVAASMAFYQDRLRRWQSAPATARPLS